MPVPAGQMRRQRRGCTSPLPFSSRKTHANHCVQTLCQCLNNRETLCKEHCPDYVPTYLVSPAFILYISDQKPLTRYSPVQPNPRRRQRPSQQTHHASAKKSCVCRCGQIHATARMPQNKSATRSAVARRQHFKYVLLPPLTLPSPSPPSSSFLVADANPRSAHPSPAPNS